MKVGIIGAGYMGKVHARILRNINAVSEIFIWDKENIQAEGLASLTDSKKLDSIDDLIKKSDAVFITTPNFTHASYIKLLAGKVKGIFCEKPMAIDLKSAKEVVDNLKNKKTIFQLGFNRRFALVYTNLKEYLKDVAPIIVNAKMNRGELLEPEWVGNSKITGGYLYETPDHILDLLAFFFGDIKTIFALGYKKVYKELDTFQILFEHFSGITSSLFSIAYSTWIFPFESMEIFSKHKAIVTEEMERIKIMQSPRDIIATLDFHSQPKEIKWGYTYEDNYFIERLSGKENKDVATEKDGYYVCYLIENIKKCISEKKQIKLKLQ